MEKELSLYVGCPTYGKAGMEFSFDSVGSLMFHIGRQRQDIKHVWMQRDVRTYRQAARQGIVEGALQAGASHLLFLDDDHTFSGKEFDLLWDTITTREDVNCISGLYFTRGLPTAPCMFTLTSQGTKPIRHYPSNDLLEVDAIGFGFCIFDMECFKRIKGPWFTLSMGFGEDVAWTTKMSAAGLKTWVHTGAKIGHILEQPIIITEEHYLVTRDQEDAHEREKAHQLVFAGFDARYARNGRGGGNGDQSGEAGHTAGSGVGNDSRPWWSPNPSRFWNGPWWPFGSRREADLARGVSEAGGEPETVSGASQEPSQGS